MNKLKTSLTAIFFIFILGFLIFVHTHGFIPYDEGWFLQAALRLKNGEIIYKDFDYLYSPGSLYLNAFAFTLFGQSILASRSIAFLNSIISVFLIYLIGKKIKFPKYLSFSTILLFVFWGPGHINFVWPVMFCITAGLASFLFFLKIRDKKNKNVLIFFTGVFSALTFILKQNFGLAIFLADIIFFLLFKKYRNLKTFLWHFTGYFLIILAQVFYFTYTGSLVSYFKQLYFFTFLKIFQQGILNSEFPWNYPSPIILRVIKIVFYLSPLLISILAAGKIWKRKNKILIYIPLVTSFYYLLSIRPTTDFVHLTPLVALSGISLSIVFVSVKKTMRFLIGITIIIFILLGFYSSLFRNYYRWNDPLIKQNAFLNNSKAMIWTNSFEVYNVTQISNYFNQHARNEKLTFVYNFTPMYYFILGKDNPTPYDYLQYGVSSDEIQKNVIKIIKDKKINHILTTVDAKRDNSLVMQFLKKNYIPVENINGAIIWQLKS